MKRRRQILLNALLLITGACTTHGCGYMAGSPHKQEIRSIHIENFTTTSLRRDIHLQLTAEIQSVIQQYSHLRLTNRENADTLLSGRIVDLSKRVTAETKNDDPRQLQYGIAVEINWQDQHSGRAIMQRQIPIDSQVQQFLVNNQHAPEVGQSRASSEKNAIRQLARQIVDQLDTPW